MKKERTLLKLTNLYLMIILLLMPLFLVEVFTEKDRLDGKIKDLRGEVERVILEKYKLSQEVEVMKREMKDLQAQLEEKENMKEDS